MTTTTVRSPAVPAASVLLAYPFRPFFLLTGLYGALAVVLWVGYLLGGWPLPLGELPLHWHAHELLFGLVPAAIAGFLLTAMTNWTGAPPLKGAGLGALVALWLAGRLVMVLAGVLPPPLVALVDLAFLPVLAIYVARVLLRYGNRRNLIMVGLLGLLTVANLLMHLSFLGLGAGWAPAGEVLAMNLIALMMVVVAGRIIPAFTANWLRMNGKNPALVRRSERLDRYALIATALMVPADLLAGVPLVGAGVALVAAAINGVRLWQWRGWHAAREPLLWVLHVGYAWIVLALVLKGLQPLVEGLSASAWLHALGTGAMGTLILGVMTRVALGHTGRPLRLPRFAVGIYLAIVGAGIVRVLVAIGLVGYQGGLLLTGVGWTAAFVLFVILYWPILSRPRADGRPG